MVSLWSTRATAKASSRRSSSVATQVMIAVSGRGAQRYAVVGHTDDYQPRSTTHVLAFDRPLGAISHAGPPEYSSDYRVAVLTIGRDQYAMVATVMQPTRRGTVCNRRSTRVMA